MSTRGAGQHRAPRLVVKILGVTFAVIVSVLATVFLLLSWQTRERLTQTIVDSLETSQTRFADLEVVRQRERQLQVAALAENPTLRAAVDIFHAERGLEEPRPGSPGLPYRTTIAPLALGSDVIGDVILAAPIDDAYAQELAAEARTDVVVRLDGRDVASSLPADTRAHLSRTPLPDTGTIILDGEEFVVRRLMSVDGASVYALGSITAPVAAATREAAWAFLAIGAGALLLAGLASWWLARTIARPIGELRHTLADMADARDFERPLPRTGTSLELDALTETFDARRSAVSAAEAESEAIYLGVIGTLAAALDARDPYTAGHSERVADLSVGIADAMGLPEQEIEVLRLGALLHDIGKIGVSDAVLRKPGTLTDDEFEQIKQHPTLGAQILRPLHFLADHLAIVELHHEQPDGRGYPYGLRGEAIPLPARIVHVADAFDAMTSARSYRPGRPAKDAMAELWRHAGTGFDLRIVQVMAMMPPAVLMRPPDSPPTPDRPERTIAGALLPFRVRLASASRRSAG